jgi:hypothetical protein
MSTVRLRLTFDDSPADRAAAALAMQTALLYPAVVDARMHPRDPGLLLVEVGELSSQPARLGADIVASLLRAEVITHGHVER